MRAIANYVVVICALSIGGLGCTSDDAASGAAGSEMKSKQARDAGSQSDTDDDASTSSGTRRPKADADAGRSNPPVILDAGMPSRSASSDAAAPMHDADSDAGPAAPSGGGPGTGSAPAAPDDIETVAVNLVYVSDLAGNLTTDARPIILFKNGWACRDMNFVVRGVDAATHRAMYPDTWVEWSIVDGKMALKNSKGGWSALYYQLKYPPNSSSLTFENTFTRLLAGVNVALGTTAVAQKDIHMWNDHRIVIGSYTGLTTPATVNQVVPPESRGTYQIDGYTIELKWDNGTTQKTSFVYSDKDPGAIYVDGAAFIDLKS